MVDLGAVLGSLMSGLISARRMADEQTAALAEYYKGIPLLEGLTVPRIRIPELTIDIPMLIENYNEGQIGRVTNLNEIGAAVKEHMRPTVSMHKAGVRPYFYKHFAEEVEGQMDILKAAEVPVLKETVARSMQNAFANALIRSKTTMSPEARDAISKTLREKVDTICTTKPPLSPNISANIMTADVKEKSSNDNVVRLKVTFKEEGLEWATQTDKNGHIVNTLQPE